MEQGAAHAADNGIDGKLVRAAVNADLVRAAIPRDFHVLAQGRFEFLQVALVIDALFKVANKSGSHADHMGNGQPTKFQTNEQMVQYAGWLTGFVHAHLDLEWAGVHRLGNVTAHEADVLEGTRVFYRG